MSDITKPIILDETGQRIAIALEEIAKGTDTVIYGVSREVASSSSAWRRIGASIGLHANATHDGTDVENDFDNLYPYNAIKTVNINDSGEVIAEYGDANFAFDGTNGEVMTYIPEFYFKREVKDGTETIQISEHHFKGSTHSRAFYIARYTTSADTHSISGVASLVNLTISTFRTQARTKGTGWGLLDYHVFILQMLYLVEYADYNSQAILGQGVCSVSAQVNTGGCDTLGMKSGCLANDGAHSVIYRGVENIFGNIWQFVDGLGIKDNVGYVSYNPTDYANETYIAPYSQVGYTNATENGNPKVLGYDANNPMVMLPTTLDGGSTTGVCDYYWQNTGNRVSLFGGSWYYGSYAGLFCWYLSVVWSSADASVGSRLLLTI